MSAVPDLLYGSRSSSRLTPAYFAAVGLVLGFSDPTGVIWLPVQFTLKDRLAFSPQALAAFEAIVLLPAAIGFVWGWLRDRWQRGGLSDHLALALGGLLTSGAYLALASPDETPDAARLLVGMVMVSIVCEITAATAEAMLTTVAQRERTTGQLSAVDEFAQVTAEVGALLIGGLLAAAALGQRAFVIAAIAAVAMVPLGVWCPRIAQVDPLALGGQRGHRQATGIRALLKHRPFWLVVAAFACWNCSPGWATPLLYYLTDEKGLSPALFGAFRAVHFAAMAAAAVLYGALCRSIPVGRVLSATVALTAAASLAILVIAGPAPALALAALAGLVTGIANIALYDVARRTCPCGMAGLCMGIATSAWVTSSLIGDLGGSWLYEQFGLAACITLDLALNAAILPLVALLPRAVRERRDGESDDAFPFN